MNSYRTSRRKVAILGWVALLFSFHASPSKAAATKQANPKATNVRAPQPTLPSTNKTSEGKKHFNAGLKLFRDKVYDGALVEFQQAYALEKKPSALRHMAQCHREMKQFSKAYEEFDRLLNEHQASLKGKKKAEIKKALSELALVTGVIAITVDQQGAKILIDEKEQGESPLAKPIRVDVGNHTVRVIKAGFEKIEWPIQMSGEDTIPLSITLKAEPLTGHILIRERKGLATHVYIDGQGKGAAPWEGDIPVGDHEIELRGQSISSPKEKVNIQKGSRLEVMLTATSTTGFFQVTTVPPIAAIIIDGKHLGTGGWKGELTKGKHTLLVMAPAHHDFSREIEILSGETVSQDVTLVPSSKRYDPEKERADEKKTYSGSFIDLNFIGAFNLKGHPDFECPPSMQCTHSASAGGGLSLRAGYLFDFVGIELATALMGDYHSEKQERMANGLPGDKFGIYGINGFIGGGLRLITKGEHAQFTMGVAPGITLSHYILHRSNPDGKVGHDNNQYFALLFDAGVALGKLGSSKFRLGALLWVGLTANDTSTNLPILTATGIETTRSKNYVMASDVQVYLGPTLGILYGY
ncbi:PEGA domain-containing protein [Pajaroellobacter abortibovis]|nr:PEGA domain-containing protein [Pajaroellobacter abortibovis]